MLVAAQTEYRSKDAEALEHFLRTSAGARRFDIPNSGAGLDLKFNVTQLNDVSLICVNANIGNTVAYEPVDYVRMIYPTRGAMNVTVRKDTDSDGRRSGIIVPNDEPWTLSHGADFESLTLRIPQRAIDRHLQSLIGSTLAQPVMFDIGATPNASHASLFRNALFQFARDVDMSSSGFSSLAMAEFENALILRFLMCNPHSYSHIFLQDDPGIGPTQLQRVEDYIAAHWDQPLDTATLAMVAGASARTLFRQFQKKHPYSPYGFVKMIRLDKARQMLLSGGENGSVIAIALRCGFQSLGHFAKAYRIRFGELPSETLRKRRLSN